MSFFLGKAKMNLKSVNTILIPQPLVPTSATICPGSASKLKPRRTDTSGLDGYEKNKLSTLTVPRKSTVSAFFSLSIADVVEFF